MKSKLFLYLAAGLNVGALSTVMYRFFKSEPSPAKKELSAVILSSLAAASTIGYLMANTKLPLFENDDILDINAETAKRLEAFVV